MRWFRWLWLRIIPMTPAELLAFIEAEQQMWKPIVRKAGIEPQ